MLGRVFFILLAGELAVLNPLPLHLASIWEERRELIIAVCAVVAVQSALIVGLLVYHAALRRAKGELAASERRMSLATESANLGLWLWEIGRDEVWAPPRYRSIFGFGAKEPVTFASIRDRVHADDREMMERQVREAIDEKQPYKAQYRIALPNEESRWIEAAGRVEYSAGGEPIRMQGVCQDVTEWRHAQSEMRRLQEEMAHVGRVSMMGQLASSLAHEINQPLGAILRNAEAGELFLESKTPDMEEIRTILSEIRADDQRAGSVINRMRSLLKRHVLDTQLLDLTELVGNVAELARPDAATRHVKLKVNLPAHLPRIRGDRVHLQQVLLNLILNGMDALNGNRENRRVTVTARLAAARNIEISVSDTGHGITDEKLGKVFDPFFTTKSDGMGMGLPISRTIVESHGGRLWVENNNGSGATFRFTLPLVGTNGA
jgi:two-component system sensor kinase FixL